MKIKLTKADREFARAVKERDGWVCRRCHKGYVPGSQGLHAAHIISRRHKATRHDLGNALSLCFACHLWGHGSPIEFSDFVRRELGTKAYNALRRKANA